MRSVILNLFVVFQSLAFKSRLNLFSFLLLGPSPYKDTNYDQDNDHYHYYNDYKDSVARFLFAFFATFVQAITICAFGA